MVDDFFLRFSEVLQLRFKVRLAAKNENAGLKARVSFVALGCRLADDLRRLQGRRGRDRRKEGECKGEAQHLVHLGIPSRKFGVFVEEMPCALDLDAQMRDFCVAH